MAKSGTPAQVKAKFASFGTYDWYGLCAGVNMTVVNHFGTKHGSPYPSAAAALAASTIESTDPAAAPAGASHFWDYYGSDSAGRKGNWGHCGVDMFGGGTKVLNASRHADENWGVNVGLDSVADITGRVGRYRGWSRKYGRHEIRIVVETPAGGGGKPAHPVTTRTVRRGTFDKLNGRTRPSTRSGKIVQTLKPGVVGHFDGYKRGQRVTVGGVTSDVWFRGAFNKNWFAAAAFTSQSTSGLKNLGTYKEPAKPAAKKKYVRIPEPYIWYDHPDDAARAVDRHYSVPKGDYPLIRVDSRGPRLIQWGNRQVWVGSTKTRPAIITK